MPNIIDPNFKKELKAKTIDEQHQFVHHYLNLILKEPNNINGLYQYVLSVEYLYEKLNQLRQSVEKEIILSHPNLQTINSQIADYFLKGTYILATNLKNIDYVDRAWSIYFKSLSLHIQKNLIEEPYFFQYLQTEFSFSTINLDDIQAQKNLTISVLKETFQDILKNSRKSTVLHQKFPDFMVWIGPFCEKETLNSQLARALQGKTNVKL